MSDYQEFRDAPPEGLPVRGFLHPPSPAGLSQSGAGLVLTHGAGSNCEAPLLVTLADAFCQSGFTVLRCDLPFRQSRAHGPPIHSAERDQQGLRSAIASLRQRVTGRVFLGGHSYGGRQASMLAAEDPGLVDHLLLLSYPLHPPRRPDQMRTAHFPRIHSPALFVHGARDGFGSIEEMEAALKLIPAPTQLLPLAAAGHELLSKRNREGTAKTIVDTFTSFIH